MPHALSCQEQKNTKLGHFLNFSRIMFCRSWLPSNRSCNWSFQCCFFQHLSHDQILGYSLPLKASFNCCVVVDVRDDFSSVMAERSITHLLHTALQSPYFMHDVFCACTTCPISLYIWLSSWNQSWYLVYPCFIYQWCKCTKCFAVWHTYSIKLESAVWLFFRLHFLWYWKWGWCHVNSGFDRKCYSCNLAVCVHKPC